VYAVDVDGVRELAMRSTRPPDPKPPVW